jgi:DNA-directed RNA polymerase subunit L
MTSHNNTSQIKVVEITNETMTQINLLAEAQLNNRLVEAAIVKMDTVIQSRPTRTRRANAINMLYELKQQDTKTRLLKTRVRIERRRLAIEQARATPSTNL